MFSPCQLCWKDDDNHFSDCLSFVVEFFAINTLGLLFATAPLDREKQEVHRFKVLVCDGQVSCTGVPLLYLWWSQNNPLHSVHCVQYEI